MRTIFCANLLPPARQLADRADGVLHGPIDKRDRSGRQRLRTARSHHTLCEHNLVDTAAVEYPLPSGRRTRPAAVSVTPQQVNGRCAGVSEQPGPAK
jgi:hypothetical protein